MVSQRSVFLLSLLLLGSSPALAARRRSGPRRVSFYTEETPHAGNKTTVPHTPDATPLEDHRAAHRVISPKEIADAQRRVARAARAAAKADRKAASKGGPLKAISRLLKSKSKKV